MKITMLLSLCLFFSSGLWAQKTINGYVQDSATGERLINAYVRIFGEQNAAQTNNYGYFTVKSTKDTCILMVSYAGYANQAIQVTSKTELPLVIPMIVEETTFKGIVVKSKKDNKIVDETQMSSVSISVAQVKLMPRFFGETDIIKAIQLMPGVKGGSEGTTGLYVRGGGPDQNLILLDGAPVYNASHLFGFFSIFNTDAINHVQLLKGGFPARYGGRLSSVLDITMKEGNMKKYKVEGSVGALASKVTVEGPIKKDKASFIISARRTYLDILLQPLLRLGNGNSGVSQGYFFNDLNAKVNWKVSKKDRLYMSYYVGKDKFYTKSKPYSYLYDGNYVSDRSEDRNQWGNQLGALRWNRIVNKNIFINTQLSYTKYYYEVFSSAASSEQSDTLLTERFNSNQFLSGIRDWSLKSDAEMTKGKHNYRAGVQLIAHRFLPGRTSIKYSETGKTSVDTSFGSDKVNSLEASAYAEDDLELSVRLKMNYGVHLNLYNYKKNFFPTIQPRLALRYLLSKTLSVKASYANMSQNIHLLTNNTIGLPNDLWVPATNLVKPMRSNQLAAGIAKNLNETYELTFEAYYKTMKNVIEFKEGASFLNVNNSWENKVAAGTGKSYGFEFLAQKKTGKVTGWIGYTLSWVKRTIPEVNFGKEFFYKYDSRHDFSFVLNYKENEKWDYGLVWVFRTGNATTLPTAAYPSYDPTYRTQNPYNPVYSYSGRNNFRFANYHRLDLSITRHIKKKWGMIDLNFSIYNAYSRINPFYYKIGVDNRGNKQITRVGLFPILPSLNLIFKI
jgi:hypothetical protein